MAEKVALKCTKCGHTWEGKPLDDRQSKPRCTQCGGAGGTIQPVEEAGESSAGDESPTGESDESSGESDSPDPPEEPEPAPEPAPEPEPARARQERITPPSPDEYADPVDEDSAVYQPRDVFNDVIEMFPNYGGKVSRENVIEYLGDMADYHGTPQPSQLYNWAVRFNGLSEGVARDLQNQYDDTLDHQLQQGNIDLEAVQKLFGIAPAGNDVGGGGPRASTHRESRTAARVESGAAGSAPPSSAAPPGQSKARMSAAEQAAAQGLPEPVERRVAQADVSPGVKDLMREMYLLGKDESQTDGGRTEAVPPDHAGGQPQQAPPQPQPQPQPEPGGGFGEELVSTLDTIEKVETKLAELRGGDSDASNEALAHLDARLQSLQAQLENQDGQSQDLSGEVEAMVVNSDLPVEEKKELLGSATKDPETVRLERKYDRYENILDKVENVASKAFSGGGEDGGPSLLYYLGQYRAGLQAAQGGGGQQDGGRPRQQPAGGRNPAGQPATTQGQERVPPNADVQPADRRSAGERAAADAEPAPEPEPEPDADEQTPVPTEETDE